MSPSTHGRTMLVGLALGLLLNSPPFLIKLGALGILFILPIVIWALPGAVISLFLPGHFSVTDMGADPDTPLAWALVAAWWFGVAFGVAFLVARRRRVAVPG